MRNLLSRILGGASPTGKALRAAHEAAEKARLEAINRDPPPGNGWRLAPQDSEGKWTVWNGPRPICSFWDENEAADYARRMNRDAQRNPVQRDDGKYCVNCGSHETDESLKARGYVSCCPERYVIPEAWAVTADRLATGNYHVWRPADGLPSIDADHSWPERADAQHEADHRNLLEFRPEAMDAWARLASVAQPRAPERSGEPLRVADLAEGLTAAKLAVTDESGHSSGFGVALGVPPVLDVDLVTESPPCQMAAPRPDWTERQAAARERFLDVPIPDGVRAVVGPYKSPDDGNWWTFDRSGPVRGYTRKTNAQAAADRANNGPAT